VAFLADELATTPTIAQNKIAALAKAKHNADRFNGTF